MKANELMIGDLLKWKEQPGFNDEDRNMVLRVKNIFDDAIKIYGRFELYHISLFEPISLTPEILEKNGFENGKLNISPQYYLEYNNVFIGVTLKDIPDKHKGIDIAKGRLYFRLDISRMEEPLYVHQLQQALKLCGIDKTIEL